MNELDLFAAAIAITDGGERASLLDKGCAGRPDLRQRLDQLLAAHLQSNPLLDQPAPEHTSAYGVPGAATASYHNAKEAVGAVIADKYTLVELIGEGGMGSVWRAKQTEPVKRFVAVKLIKAGMDSKQVLARFEAERQALALMDHPNIAKVLDGGMTGEPSRVSDRVLSDETQRLTSLGSPRPFFVMELVKGVPITEYCDHFKLTPKQRLELFVPVCQAIQHAHQKGIIHRDIKPRNVLVAMYDDKPVVKVIDFGVAKATGGTLTEATIDTGFGGVVGTPQYMSPEQATFNNIDIDTRSDVYALGVLLYELLTGSPPFSQKDLEKKGLLEMLRVVREEEPPRPSTKLSTADALPSLSANRSTEPNKLTGLLRNELDWIVMKALEKDRARRYETANGFAADINRYLYGEPVLAHPPSAAYRLKKFVRRNKGQVIAASLVFLALAAGIIGTTIGLLHARAKERDAIQAAERESEQRVKAEKARDRTRDVLDAMTSEATGDSLSTQKEISAEQKKFLQEVLTYYQEFAGEKAEDRPSRERTARAAYKVGMIEFRLSRTEESAAAFRMARDLSAALAAEFPAVPAYRRDLAGNHNNLGVLLYGLGQRAEAEAEYRRALAIQEKLAAEFPAGPAYRQELAGSHINLGNLFADLGQRTEAGAEYGKALAIREKLAAEFPSVPAHRQELATSHNNLGKLLADLGQWAEAKAEYRQALAIREKLAAEFTAVPAYRQELAGSHNNLGNLLDDLGQRTEAEPEYRRALAIREKLAAEFPGVPEYRSELAITHNNLGSLLADLGQRAEAEAEYRQALAIQEKLAAEFPAVPEYRQDLARSHNNLGILLGGLGQRAEAEAEYRRALAIREKLAAEFAAVPECRQDLARSHNNLGVLLDDLGRRAEAEPEYRRALAIQEKLAAEFPAVPAYQVALGGGYCNFGQLARDNGRAADSLEWFAKAIRTLTPVHEREPRAVVARQFLRNSYWGRARAHDQLRKYAEAVADWDKAIKLSPKQEQPSYQASRASSRLQAGQVAEAVAEVAELTKQSDWNAGQWFDFACVYAVASKTGGLNPPARQEYADRAMELLQKAVKAGYKDASHMKKDTDLDPLRDRDDFKKLLAELEGMEGKK